MTHCLKCTICDTDIEVPMCCEKDMTVKDGKLACTMCGDNKEIPVCCDKKMELAEKA